MKIKPCNNISACHTLVIIGEDNSAIRIICTTCKEQIVIHKDHRGVLNNREYSQVFRKDILQGNDNLFYKYHDEYLKK